MKHVTPSPHQDRLFAGLVLVILLLVGWTVWQQDRLARLAPTLGGGERVAMRKLDPDELRRGLAEQRLSDVKARHYRVLDPKELQP